jgi:outer membrane protein OmpA-like peptidoglycan-associated protein
MRNSAPTARARTSLQARVCALGLLACCATGGLAQPAAPSTEQMIQQLAPARTRSLRNLTVEAAAPETAQTTEATVSAATGITSRPSSPRPSLSLLIQFDFNSVRVRPESQQALANLAQALQAPELSAARFAIEGHTDAKGGADYNQRLSQQRAQAVKQVLASRGIDEARLQPVGKGSSEPANPADPLAAENRRVRVVNLD